MGGNQSDREIGLNRFEACDEGLQFRVGQPGSGDDHVETAALHHFAGLGTGRSSGEARSVPEVEVQIPVLLKDKFGELPVLLEDKGVIVGGNQENLNDAVLHQRRELLGLHTVPARELQRCCHLFEGSRRRAFSSPTQRGEILNFEFSILNCPPPTQYWEGGWNSKLRTEN